MAAPRGLAVATAMPLRLRLPLRSTLALWRPRVRAVAVRIGLLVATLAWMFVGTLVSVSVYSVRLASTYRFVAVRPIRAAWRYRSSPVVGLRIASQAAVALRSYVIRYRSSLAPYF